MGMSKKEVLLKTDKHFVNVTRKPKRADIYFGLRDGTGAHGHVVFISDTVSKTMPIETIPFILRGEEGGEAYVLGLKCFVFEGIVFMF